MDVGLALAFGGVAYLLWVLAVGAGRHTANEVSKSMHLQRIPLTELGQSSKWLFNTFLQAAPVLDVAGILWLALSLVLIVGASRQRWSISWAWVCAICETITAGLLAVWSGLASQGACMRRVISHAPPAYPTTGWTFMSVAVCIALVLWVTVLVWLLYERARLRRGPSMRDGLRTHVPG